MSDKYQSCPCCEAELATVKMSTDAGEIQIGPKCSRLLEQFARLMGANPQRRPALTVVE